MAAHYPKTKNNTENLELLEAEVVRVEKPIDYAPMIRKARKLLRLIDAGLSLFNGR